MAAMSPLDDPEISARAWARWRRMMRMTALVALLVSAGVCAVLYRTNGWTSIHYYVAVALGIWATIMLAALLMGLVFLSSGTGHDEAAARGGDQDPDSSSG